MSVTALATVPMQILPGGLTPIVVNDVGASIILVPGVANQLINVWAYDLDTNGITDLVFLSGAVPISAPLGFGANSGPSNQTWPGSGLPIGRPGVDWTFPRMTTIALGDSLILTNSGAGVRVSGTIWVEQRYAPQAGR
jgi:hypothetical protein